MKFSARVPSDVVMGVLHFMGGGTRFYCNHLMLQRFFYWASTQEEYKDLFKRWIFATDGIVPRSQTLTFGLDRLGLSQLFYSVTLISDDYEVSSYLGGEEIQEELEELFSPEEIEQMRRLAGELLRYSKKEEKASAV